MYLNTETNKMEAYARIDVVFDVYSEKIIGYSLSETESITDHFRAVKMAVQTAGVRPFLCAYDKQSGHISAKMQGDLFGDSHSQRWRHTLLHKNRNITHQRRGY